MAVNPSALGPKPQIVDSAGLPAVGYQLFFYAAGTIGTKQDTYTNSTGLAANTNPIVLNALGEPTNEIWWTAGLSYKVVLAPANDTDPPSSPIWSIDNLQGINDTTTAAPDQWVASGLVPTFISTTSFSVLGDQTSAFQVGRRVRTTNSGGTIYSTITASVFGAVTTVTVVNDSGVLDSGLSAVSYGLLTPLNDSMPRGIFPIMTTLVNSLAADVNLNNTANYFTGPTVAQGTTGTWFASGTVTVIDGAGGATFVARLWDGNNVMASTVVTQSGASLRATISLSGRIANPIGNIRISVKDISSTSGKILFNESGDSKDSTLTVMSIA